MVPAQTTTLFYSVEAEEGYRTKATDMANATLNSPRHHQKARGHPA